MSIKKLMCSKCHKSKGVDCSGFGEGGKYDVKCLFCGHTWLRKAGYFKGNYVCKKLAPVGYRGQRYIVTCKDEEGKDMTVGWTNNTNGKPLVNCVNKHPSWSDPRIERMPEHMITQ